MSGTVEEPGEPMQTKSYVDAAVAWACTRLDAIERGAGDEAKAELKALDEAAAADVALGDLLRFFGVTLPERRVIDLAIAVEHAHRAARAARRLSGTRGLTVEVVREALAGDVGLLLAPSGSLRLHGLVSVGGMPGGLAGAQADVTLGPGLRARLAGRAPQPGELGAGIELIAPSIENVPVPEALANVVKDELLDARSRWVTVSGGQAGDALALAVGLAKRLRRPVVLVDGRAFVGVDAAAAWSTLAAARREADLRDAPVVVDEAAALGGLWRAIAARPAPGATLPSPVVLVDRGATVGARPAGFVLRELSFAPAGPATAATGATSTAAPAPVAAPPPPPVDDGFEAVRRQAAIDVARALGKPIPVTLAEMPSKAVVPRHMAAPAAAPVEPPRPVEAPKPVAAEGPKPVEVAKPVEPVEAAKAAEPVAAAAEPESKKKGRGKKKGAKAEVEATPAPSTPAASEPAPAPSAPAASPPDPAEATAYVAVPPDAKVTDLLQLLPTVTNPLQRADVLALLAAEQRNPLVAATMRAHLKSEHPKVRGAAEQGMEKLFGANWNKTREIPKPKQPPRSEEPDRGPPGGW